MMSRPLAYGTGRLCYSTTQLLLNHSRKWLSLALLTTVVTATCACALETFKTQNA